MECQLIVEGPFAIAFDRATKGNIKHIGKTHAASFWQKDEVGHLVLKQGCYIFASRAAKGFTPWYVGKATKGFKQEIFTPSKLNHYNGALHRGKNGNPVMFFVTQEGTKKKIAGPVIRDMEKFLIQTALEKNSDLCNIQHTKNLTKWGIRGVLRGGKGKPKDNAKKFKCMMGL